MRQHLVSLSLLAHFVFLINFRSVVDLSNNKLDDPAIVDIFSAMKSIRSKYSQPFDFELARPPCATSHWKPRYSQDRALQKGVFVSPT